MHQLQLTTSWGDLRLVGGSRAGEASLLLLPQLRLALDAGRPSRALVPLSTVVISHGHMDHILGLPAWASQRQLQGMQGGRVYVSPTTKPGVDALLRLCARLEGGKPYDVEVLEVGSGQVVPLRREIDLRFFLTTHWVETLGCCIEWTRRRLLPELAGLDAVALRQKREAGEAITTEVRTPLLAYLADTGPEVFDNQPWLADVEVLVVECTFLRSTDRDRARRFGHTHLDDLVAVAPRLHNRHIVLTHLSRRHRLAWGTRRMREGLQNRLHADLHFLNLEWD